MNFKKLFIVSALTLTTLGCSSTNVNQVHAKKPNASPTLVSFTEAIMDASLKKKARVVELKSALSGNLKLIQATLQNDTSKDINIAYIFNWYDKDGISIDSPTISWKRVNLAGKQEVSIKSLAPTPQAVDFKLQLKESR